MPQAYFFNIGKRADSTGAPALNTGTPLNITYKGAYSIENPMIQLRLVTPPLYNYFYLPDFSRYYFIRERKFNEGLWEISGEVDPLASFRSVILGNSGYCMYSASRYNKYIMDSRIQQTATTKYITSSESFTTVGGGAFFSSAGTYFLVTSGGGGVTNLFAIGTAQLGQIGLALDSANDNIIEKLQKKFGAMANAILSCYWLPIDSGAVSGTDGTAIYLGDYNTGATGKSVSTIKTASLISHTIAFEKDDFRRLSPYTTINVFLPFVGTVPISTVDLLSADGLTASDTLGIQAVVNLRLGTVLYKVTSGDPLTSNAILATYSANIKTTIPITTYSSNVMGEATGIMAVGGAIAGTALTGGAALPLATLAGGAINATAGSLERSISSIGSYSGSGGEALGLSCIVNMEYHDSNAEPSTLYPSIGGPLFERVSVGSLSGFAQFNSFSVSGGSDMTASERDKINSIMNGGVYIE